MDVQHRRARQKAVDGAPVAAGRLSKLGWLVRLSLVVGVLAAAAALLAGPSYRLHLLDLGASLSTMRGAAFAAMAGAVLAGVAIALALGSSARRTATLGLAAFALNAAVAAPLLLMYQRAQTLPRIHDVTTDTDDPPTFAAVLKLRTDARNPVTYSAQTVALQKQGYPDIASLHLSIAPTLAFRRAEAVVHKLGWAVAAADPGQLRIEATDTTLLFGFKDDIVIRIRPDAAGSKVDARSLSRVGGSDFGTNANRIRAFLREMQAAPAS